MKRLIYVRKFSTYPQGELRKSTLFVDDQADKLIGDIDKKIEDLSKTRESITNEKSSLRKLRESILDYNSAVRYCERLKDSRPEEYESKKFWQEECNVNSADEYIKSEKVKVNDAIKSHKALGTKFLNDDFIKLVKLFDEIQR